VAPASSVAAPEPDALDLLQLAGNSVYKRLIPLVAVVVIVVAVVVYLVLR
jgi:hypothetical protein